EFCIADICGDTWHSTSHSLTEHVRKTLSVRRRERHNVESGIEHTKIGSLAEQLNPAPQIAFRYSPAQPQISRLNRRSNACELDIRPRFREQCCSSKKIVMIFHRVMTRC